MNATVVYRFTEDGFLVGWNNQRVALVRLELDAERIASALETFAANGWTVKTHNNCDGADISKGGVRYFLAPLTLVAYVGKLVA